MYANSRIIDEENRRREKEQFKQEVAEYVISHIKATVDISEVLMEIEELRKAIESLGKGGRDNATYHISKPTHGQGSP